ncbi:MAG: heme ABC exporter ATP-binding protein CcmA [Rhizobiaceae bacterium]
MKVVAENLSVVRGEDLIFSDLSFDVSKGKALIVRGPNGAGKSTLLRAIAGLLPIEGGQIKVEDAAPEFGDARLAELCHYLGPDNAMKSSMSVEENLQFWQEFAGQPHFDIDEALDMVGLGGLEAIPFGHLSTGQRRRISIARLLVSYRPIWLLDEPTSGLDTASEIQFAGLMQAHLDDEGIIIAATHIPLGLKGVTEFVFGESGSEHE